MNKILAADRVLVLIVGISVGIVVGTLFAVMVGAL